MMLNGLRAKGRPLERASHLVPRHLYGLHLVLHFATRSKQVQMLILIP